MSVYRKIARRLQLGVWFNLWEPLARALRLVGVLAATEAGKYEERQP